MNANLGSILTTHTTLHERVATATETSAVWLQSIDGKMDLLIGTTANQVAAIDARFSATQALARLSIGQGPEF
jgi:hypothetical protein